MTYSAKVYEAWLSGRDRSQMWCEFQRVLREIVAVKNGEASEVSIPFDGGDELTTFGTKRFAKSFPRVQTQPSRAEAAR